MIIDNSDLGRIPFFFMLLVTAHIVSAQSFNINILFESPPRGRVVLTIYDTDTLPHTIRKKATKNNASFNGEVTRPCYAEASLSDGQRVGFFVENSNISVRFNKEAPESSQITGSRTNSLYRYALEQCRESDGSYDVTKLAEHVRENKSAVYAPLLIYRYILPQGNKTLVNELTSALEGDATTTYHYRLLNSQFKKHSSENTDKLPDITFFDSNHKRRHTDSLLVDSNYNLIIVGATWCKQCRDAKEEALRQHKGLNIITIDIDNDKKLWDAEVIKKLQIEHLPYLILVDPKKKIVALDIRAWEIKRELTLTPY